VESKSAATFIDDFKRLGKGFPDAVAKVRELSGAAEADFVVIAQSNSNPAGRLRQN
jgi:aspartyl-tRNA synthetase